ncbi:MAG: NAD(P)-dependent oxidoreductase [Chloroflexi bacterium]|nr:NAD(P)-dependent oxidoreductase [Chloroflexota bacterium]
MIVAITGGTGFIGRQLVEQHLSLGDEVRVISRRRASQIDLPQPVKVFQGDIADSATDLGPFVQGTDVLYHCAGEIIDLDKMHDIHIVGTERLIAAAAGQVDHWVQLSSVAVYGPVIANVSEESPLKPIGEYGETKAKAEQLVMAAASRNNFSYSILRPASVFGKGMNNQSLFHIIAAVNRGYFFFVGPPGAKANCVHVADVVRGMMACGAMPEAKNHIYNLSQSINMEDFVAVVAATLDKPAPKLRLPERPTRALAKMFSFLPGFPLTTSRVDALTTTTVYVSEKIERDLDYKPHVLLQDGLRQLVEIWRSER